MVKRLFISVLAAMGLAWPMVADTEAGLLTYSNYFGNSLIDYIGNKRLETYDSAIGLHREELTGCRVCGVRIPFDSMDRLSNFKVWLTRELTVQNSKNVADIASFDVEPQLVDGYVTYMFDEPYEIGSEGMYVGYSFTVTELNEDSNYPIAICDEIHPDGYWAHSSKTTLRWLDKVDVLGCCLAMDVIIDGAPAAAATVSVPGVRHTQVGGTYAVELDVTNLGYEGVQTVGYTVALGGKKFSGTCTATAACEARSNLFGSSNNAIITIEAPDGVGEFPLDVEITQVNDKANASTQRNGSGMIVTHEFLPRHRPVLEEYTGTWCGWCIRGAVALKSMSELHPDDFIGLAYHNDDPMTIMEIDKFPQYPAQFPFAFIDRGGWVDPYFGSGDAHLGVRYDWLERSYELAPADIDVEASLSADRRTVWVSADLTFEKSHSEAAYKLAYVLVNDGMTPPADKTQQGYAEWMQGNAYSADAYSTNRQRYGDNEYLGPYVDMPLFVDDFVYDHVVVMTSDVHGIAGSLPQTIQAMSPVHHSYTFNINRARNIDGKAIIQDTDRLSAVVMLIDAEGRIANANICPVATDSNSVADVSTAVDDTVVAYYDLNGRRYDAPVRGLCIALTASGKAFKIINK